MPLSDGSDDARSAILERIARFRTMDEEVPPVWQAKRDLAASVRELLDCICATDAGEANLRDASSAIREMAERFAKTPRMTDPPGVAETALAAGGTFSGMETFHIGGASQ